MKFHFSLWNHGPGAVTLHDYIVILSDGLRQLGHEVGFDATRMDTEAVNILFEHFPPAIVTALHDSGCKYAVVATEHPSVMPDGTVRLNQRDDAEFAPRSAGFVDAVKRAEFVWSMWPGSENYYRHYCPASYIELGYSEILAAEYASSVEPDLDACFAGVMTPHRLAILDGLQQRGMVVGNKPGLVPVAERNAMMSRSKLILCLKQHPTWALGSASRVAGALHAGRLPCQERVAVASRPCNFAAEPEPGQPYIDWVMDQRDRSWRLSAELHQTEYKERMPCKVTMERALDGIASKVIADVHN